MKESMTYTALYNDLYWNITTKTFSPGPRSGVCAKHILFPP